MIAAIRPVSRQVVVAGYLNGDLPGLPLAMKAKRPIRGLAQVRSTTEVLDGEGCMGVESGSPKRFTPSLPRPLSL